MNDLMLNKLGATFIILGMTVAFSVLPLALRNFLLKTSSLSEKCTIVTLSAFLCFGAGILMGIVFLHILAEVRHTFDAMMDQKIIKKMDYPLSEIMLCSGFFLLYLLEEFAHFCVERRDKPKKSTQSNVSKSFSVSSNNNSCDSENSFTTKSHEREGGPNLSENTAGYCRQPNAIYSLEIVSHERELNVNKTRGNLDTMHSLDINKISLQSISEESSSSEDPSNHFSIVENSEMSLIRSSLVIFALSLHGVFEGLTLGLEANVNKVWLLCFALASHKVFIGFSIGMELLEIGIKRLLYAIQILIFSFASPIGALIGMTLRESVEEKDYIGRIILGVLQGVSGGAIFYVTFCEILERERNKAVGRFIRLLSLIAGFLVIATLLEVAGHEHFKNEEPHMYNRTGNNIGNKI